jgi:hypothetical protein
MKRRIRNPIVRTDNDDDELRERARLAWPLLYLAVSLLCLKRPLANCYF